MGCKLPRFGANRRARLLKRGQRAGCPKTYLRFQILVFLCGGLAPKKVCALLQTSRSTLQRTKRRYLKFGVWGLYDFRQFNGPDVKITKTLLSALRKLVRTTPQKYGYLRGAWTRELFQLVLWEHWKIRVSLSTLSRALRRIRAKRKRPRTDTKCAWPKRKIRRRLRSLKWLFKNPKEREVVLYEDEVDIHLNPKLGPDWMMPGQRKGVRTPGKNQKQYIAGAYDPKDGALIWIAGPSKASALFCALVDAVMEAYPKAKKVHLILDNYSIHKSKITEKHIEPYADRLRLHFLPPYCPQGNKIERLWKDLHDNVTRNHKCKTIEALMDNVDQYLLHRLLKRKGAPKLRRRKAA